MQNTFWTLIENGFYRIEDKQLKYAPVNPIDNTIILEEVQMITTISDELLKIISKEFNTDISI